MTREEREDVIDIIQSILDKYEENECLVTEITIGDEDIKAFKMAIKALEQEPRKGHWEYGYAFSDGNYCKCSECKEIIKCIYPMHYCPNCGSDNGEVKE